MGMKIHDPNRERIVLRDHAEAETTIIYTVPAEHIFYLEEVDLSPWEFAIGFCSVFLRDEADDTVRGFASITISTLVGAIVSDHAVFPSFIRCEAGYDICAYSDAVNLDAHGSISGFLVTTGI